MLVVAIAELDCPWFMSSTNSQVVFKLISTMTLTTKL